MRIEVLTRRPAGETRPTPILFVHGAWHGAWCWEERFMPYFVDRGYACSAISLRGHGASEGRSRLRWFSLDDYVADLTQVVRTLPTPPILIAHSMGGMVAQKYLARGGPAASVVLLASVPPTWGALPAALRFAGRHPLVLLKGIATLSLYPLIGTPELARDGLFSASLPEAEVRGYFPNLQDEAFRAFLDMLGLSLARPRPGHVPMLVLGGASDRIISPADVRHTARAWGAPFEILPDTAHDVMLDTHWEAAAQRVASWLA